MTDFNDSATNAFALDMMAGLNSSPKRSFSKYFYDDEGSRIFQEIMALPEYYLTEAEAEILSTQGAAIWKALNDEQPLQVIELGAGDGAKTVHLLGDLLAHHPSALTYHPVDISQEALDIAKMRMQEELPDLEVEPLAGDYFEVLEALPDAPGSRLILFLGSNIGNYAPPRDQEMLAHIASLMRPGDHLLLGADLKKNPNTIRAAYDDAQGVTRRFNMNLLTRMNRELGADFDLEQWDFYCQYTPDNGEVRSYLVSLKEQTVHFGKLDKRIDFEQYELIWTELSKKYSLDELSEIGGPCGLHCKQHFQDKLGLFSDTLYIKI